MKWMDSGINAQIDYRKNNKKLSVFPMEWIVMQNYENSNTLQFDDKHWKNKVKNLFKY